LKVVVSVSLGSRKRDHLVVARFLGEEVQISREGTDGDVDRAVERIAELDGKVGAIGLGGLDVYLFAGGRRYVVREGERLMQAAKVTPVVDGSSLKDTLERDVIRGLARDGLLGPETHVLMVAAADRFGMAEAFAEAGCQVVFGDLIFAMGMPYPITTLDELSEVARKILPEMAKLPLAMLYPQGAAQEAEPDAKFARFFEGVDVVAGDWHLIRKYLPPSIEGKTIITNTTTRDDVALLQGRGARRLVTTTPVLEGRSFGTNVLEAMIVALAGKRPDELGEEGFRGYLDRLHLVPNITVLGG